ncbi:MAG: hypothetical protein JWM34_5096 [Ilumatobacteraceae bacterium]|nr:hypothetical protein [Ilumatobacteraceae bacterium]
MTTNTEPMYDVVWPRSPLGVQSRQAAQRLETLVGKRIAFVWDYLFRGEEIFAALERTLKHRYEGIEVVGYDVFGNIHGPDEHAIIRDLPMALTEHGIDAVVVGNGC